MRARLKYYYKRSIALIWLIILSPVVLASTNAMPWQGPLDKILESIQGPIAKSLGVIAIVIAGIGIAFGESGSGIRKIFQIVFGLSIAFTATSIITSLFGI